MPNAKTPPDNFDRLLKHLKAGSLAASFVQAHRAPGAASPRDALRAVLKTRLEQLRRTLAGTKD